VSSPIYDIKSEADLSNYQPPNQLNQDHDGLCVRSSAVIGSSIVMATVILLGSWFVLIEHTRILLDNMQTKAEVITGLVSNVAAGSLIIEDYTSVLNDCSDIVAKDRSVLYIVMRRHDGFSLVHTANSWDIRQLQDDSLPVGSGSSGEITRTELMDREAYLYSAPLNVSGSEWGWIHVALSLESYNAAVRAMYLQTAGGALSCIIIGLAANLFWTAKLAALRTTIPGRAPAGGNATTDPMQPIALDCMIDCGDTRKPDEPASPCESIAPPGTDRHAIPEVPMDADLTDADPLPVPARTA
jgi:hypothetical protein